MPLFLVSLFLVSLVPLVLLPLLLARWSLAARKTGEKKQHTRMREFRIGRRFDRYSSGGSNRGFRPPKGEEENEEEEKKWARRGRVLRGRRESSSPRKFVGGVSESAGAEGGER